MKNQNEFKVEISSKTLVFGAFLFIGLIVAWELRIVFFMFFIAYIISATFRPAVDFLEKKKIPRAISTILIIIINFAFIGLLVVSITSEAYKQLNSMFSQLPNIVYNILTNINKSLPVNNLIDPQAIKDNLKDIVGVIMKLDLNIFTSGISSAVGILSAAATATIAISMVAVLSIYMLMRKDDVAANFLIFLNKSNESHYIEIFKKIERKLGGWLRAQVLVMFSAGFLVWLGLSIPALFFPNYSLHNYALPIALLVFIIEIIPGFGISSGGILTVVIALATGNVFLIIYAALLFMSVQQLESMLIVPKVMNKAIDLDPVVTILAIVAGSLLFGVLGVILIIPMIAVVKILLSEFIEHRKS